MLGLAEIEGEYRRERQMAGIAVAKREKPSKYQGRKPGTTKGEPERARKLQANGMSAPEIARALGVSPRTVFRYLQAAR